MENVIVTIIGPTAVGKTDLAIRVAKELGGEIVSADSMQVYRGMDIGTAKPSMAERQGIPHHLIDVVDPSSDFTVAEYQTLAEQAIESIHQRNKVVVLTGGTGLYVKAVLEGFAFPGDVEDLALRARLQTEADEKGNESIYEKLLEVDPQAAAKLHPNDVRRVIRALEVYHVTGIPFSLHIKRQANSPARYQSVKFGLTRNRQELYQRCDLRVDIMLEAGLLDEVRHLLELGFDPRSTALQAIGYKELLGFLAGEYDWEEAVGRLKRNTRRYAKRQFTWFLRDKEIQWLALDQISQDQALLEIVSNYRRKVKENIEN